MRRLPALTTVCVIVGCLGAVAGFVFANWYPGVQHVTASASASLQSELIPELVSVEISSNGQPKYALAIAKYEVSYAEWDRCVAAGSCRHKPKVHPYTRPDHPVSGVSWNDVQHYLAWISNQTDQNFRLPKASEWRNFSSDILIKNNKKLFDDPRMDWANEYMNFGMRGERMTQPIGHFGVSASGVADLAGNVWEWTDTCRRSFDSYGSQEKTDNCGGVRVLAGTHMTYQSEVIRFVPIGGCSIGFPPANIGFRVVLDGPIA